MAEHNQRFETFQTWVNKASSWLTRREGKAICFDAKGRQCLIGRDMERAHDEGAFPVRWIWDWQIGQALLGYEALLPPEHHGIAFRMADELTPPPAPHPGAELAGED